MRKLALLLLSCLTALGLAAVLTGCGGAECGEGTIEQDGECVMEHDIDCPPGHVLEGGECISECAADEVLKDGECAAEVTCGANTTASDDGTECIADDPVECGENTELAADTNECIVTDETCGENTAFSAEANQCLPTGDVCTDGTHFDEETGLCYPDASCKPGDVVIDGVCSSQGEQLFAEAEVIAEGNTNPDLGGEPADLGVDDVGDEVVFGGTIGEPEDFDEDEQLDQQMGFFRLDAEAGDWFEITIHSAGLPDPMFGVYSEEYDEHYYERFSGDGTGSTKTRQIAVPEDGSYLITVFPGAIPKPNLLVGDEDWNYAGTVEKIETPDAQNHAFDDQNLEGTLGSLGDHFYRIGGLEEGRNLQLTWEDAPANADQLVQAWASPTEPLGEFSGSSVSVEVPDTGDVFVVFDWQTRMGDHGLDFEIALEETEDLDPGEVIEETFTAEDGDTVSISVEFDSPSIYSTVNVEVTDDNDEVVDQSSLYSGEPLIISDLEAGEHTVTIENPSTLDTYENFVYAISLGSPAEFEFTVDADDVGDVAVVSHDGAAPMELAVYFEDDEEPLDTGEVSPGGGLPLVGVESGDYTVEHVDFGDIEIEYIAPEEVNDLDATYSGSVDDGAFFENDYYVLEFSETTSVEIDLEHTGGSGWPTYFVYEYGHNLVDQVGISFAGDISGEFIAEADTPYIIRVGGVYGGADAWDYDYDLTFEGATFEEHEFTVSDDGEIVQISHTYDDETLELILIDDDGDEITSGFVHSDDDGMAAVSLEPGDYTVQFLDSGDLPGGELETEFITPTEITDFSATQSGTTDQYEYATHDYYAVEVQEDITYEVTVTHVDGDGWTKPFIYGTGHDLLAEASLPAYTSSPTSTLEFEFEANTPYVLRIGHTFSTLDEIDYDLTFEEVTDDNGDNDNGDNDD